MLKKLLLITVMAATCCLPAQASREEDLFIEAFAKAYGDAVGRATVAYLIQRYEQRYGRYGLGETWSGYRVYDHPGLFPEVSERYLNPSELVGLSKMALWVMRNEVYARHGRKFTYAPLQNYFMKQSWYRINPHYSDRLLSQTEKRNAGFILKYEQKMGYM